MRPLLRRALALLVLLPLLALLTITSDHPFPTPTGPGPAAPHVIVAMGDSTMSGEGAGAYEPDTDGANGDFCHRSTRAAIHQVSVPGVTRTLNIACSGAKTDNVALGSASQNTERSQARQLADLASHYRVEAIVLAVGANDDPHFADVLNRCVQGWFDHRDECSQQIGPDWPGRVRKVVPKIEHALHDIRTVMREAGYPDPSYQLVLQSYAAPVGPDLPSSLQNLSGCPLRTGDLRWIQDTAVAQLDDGIRAAAQAAGARYLDLSRAGTRHGACSGGDNDRTEWFTRLTVDWNSLRTDNARAAHSLQESFHPNDRGHAAIGHCLTEFLATDNRTAACLPGPDNTLHATTGLALLLNR
jgi:lysophospholipase L1-like esterase